MKFGKCILLASYIQGSTYVGMQLISSLCISVTFIQVFLGT